MLQIYRKFLLSIQILIFLVCDSLHVWCFVLFFLIHILTYPKTSITKLQSSPFLSLLHQWRLRYHPRLRLLSLHHRFSPTKVSTIVAPLLPTNLSLLESLTLFSLLPRYYPFLNLSIPLPVIVAGILLIRILHLLRRRHLCSSFSSLLLVRLKSFSILGLKLRLIERVML